MKTLTILILLSIMCFSGCAAMQQRQAEMRQQFSETIPVCIDELDCKEKWSAAQIWVSRNCGMKIQILSDTIIETYNSPQASMNLACSVVKEPSGGGRYKILIRTGCSNIFGCSPDGWDAAINFNKYISSINKRSSHEIF